MKRNIYVALAVLMVVVAGYFLLAFIFTRSAGYIFNQVMAQQHLVRGSVRVESLVAHVNGHVEFEQLEWDDLDGDPILIVPKGLVKLRMWDVVRGKFRASTIRELTLEEAKLVVDLDDRMQLDLLGSSARAKKVSEEKKTRKTRQERQADLEKRIRNFAWKGQFIDATVRLVNCQLEVFQQNRYYALTDVNAELQVQSKKHIKMNVSTGPFEGDAVGQALKIEGAIDLSKPLPAMPTMDLHLDANAINPGSMGFGNVNDAMTLQAHMTGPLSHPVAQGHLVMPILRIPALTFTNVVGDIHYDDGLLTFTDVSANAFQGRLKAQGTYNLDTRAYHIQGDIKDLNSSEALQSPDLEVPIDAHIEMDSQGRRHDVFVTGTFEARGGRYITIPVESIRGRFDNQYRQLDFYDVRIKLPSGEIQTDAFHILSGKLQMDYLNILDSQGRSMYLSRQHIESDLGALERARKASQSLGPHIDSIQDNVEDMKAGQVQIKEAATGTKDLGGRIRELNSLFSRIKEAVTPP